MPIPVSSRSKACVYGHSVNGIVRLNFAGAWMYVVSVVCYQVEVCINPYLANVENTVST